MLPVDVSRKTRTKVSDRPLPVEILLIALAAVGAALILYGCYTNPATGSKQLSLISESQEISMGRQADQQISAQMGLYKDQPWEAYIDSIGHNLAALSHRPDLPWTFRIIDDPTVNAFALPGGFNYVTRGLLYHVNNEAELAGVMGHEIGHVTAKHSVNQMSRQQIAQIGLIAGTIIEPDIQKYGQLIGAGMGLLFMKFSRDDEREADDLGLLYMYKAGYDPREMDDVFMVFQRMSAAQGGRGIPEWMSTHPNPENRIERIQQALDTLPGDFSTMVEREELYMNRLDGLPYGMDPRLGYFVGQDFYHPNMKFQLSFPANWETANMASAVIGISPEEDVIIQLAVSQATTLSGAAEQLAGQDGVTMDQPRGVTVNGLTAMTADFVAQTQQGTLAGNALYIRYSDQVFQLLGYGAQSAWASKGEAAMRAMRTFAPLSDPARINVEPKRIRIVDLSESMTLQQFNIKYPSTIDIEKLALINHVDVGEVMPRGRKVKRVVGKLPGE